MLIQGRYICRKTWQIEADDCAMIVKRKITCDKLSNNLTVAKHMPRQL